MPVAVDISAFGRAPASLEKIEDLNHYKMLEEHVG
jgi:hypothetical protein